MFKGRNGLLLFIIIILLTLAAFLFVRNRGGLSGLFGAEPTPTIPFDLQTLVPSSWQVQNEPQPICSFDDDPAQEQLVIFRYDATTLTPPLTTDAGTAGPFGGVIFDTQADTLPERPDPPGPYRAPNITLYKLLPDFYPDKGQGYLGETGVQIRYFPALVSGDACQVTEINIFGYTGTNLPTRLSIFRWVDAASGYQGEHYAGNARVESDIQPDGSNQITSVTTYNRLLNHRSVLCDVDSYTRPNRDVVRFIPDPAKKTIDFCFDVPDDPVYPEGVVVALLRGADPQNGVPPSYLLDDAIVAPDLDVLRRTNRDPINIVSVGNPSSVEPDEARGTWCTTEQINTAEVETLWCARERVRVETRIMLDGVVRQAVWILISVVANTPNAELVWRIEEVELS